MKTRAAQLDAWRRSSAFRLIARQQCQRLNRERLLLPRCGAHAKTTGAPCRQAAMENGRCWLHGGRVPRGDGWHQPLWPDKHAPNAAEKLGRKLNDQQRAAAQRKKRVAKMTEEELAAYKKWQRDHKPGPAAARAVRRKERADAAGFGKPAERPPNLDVMALQAEIDRLKDEQAASRERFRGVFL